tara:strand:- start:390 stop:587 length:198 start_codon:yes stop_codon:yes gene_type:complete
MMPHELFHELFSKGTNDLSKKKHDFLILIIDNITIQKSKLIVIYYDSSLNEGPAKSSPKQNIVIT